MRVLIACEFSGIVREAFTARGHDAWSCDFLDTEQKGNHVKGNVRVLLRRDKHWDLMIAHPPCTYLCASGARWWAGRRIEQLNAIRFVKFLQGQAQIPKIAIENPIGILSRLIGKPNQIVQPWMFGYPVTKATCLWLKGLDPLEPRIHKRPKKVFPLVHLESSSPDRWKRRSRTYECIAQAMAEQWG